MDLSFVPEGRWTLAGDEITGEALARHSRPGRAPDLPLSPFQGSKMWGAAAPVISSPANFCRASGAKNRQHFPDLNIPSAQVVIFCCPLLTAHCPLP
jgi:hypothetical protein